MKVLTCFIFLFPLSLLGQDTVVYCQKSAFMFSDCYTFYKEDVGDKNGNFIHEISTDDGQTWFGKGSFLERKKKFVLKYNPHYDTLSVNIVIDSAVVSDSVLFIDKSLAQFSCYSYSPKKPEDAFFYYFDIYSNPTYKLKKEFSQEKFWIDHRNNQSFKIPKTDRLIIVSIKYNPSYLVHFLSPKKKERLKKSKNGFKVKAMWSNKRKELFIKKVSHNKHPTYLVHLYSF